jgi:hypothetical protein
MLKQDEMEAIKAVLVDGGTTTPKDELVKKIDILATLRSELRCDNHELHRLYSEQLKRRK